MRSWHAPLHRVTERRAPERTRLASFVMLTVVRSHALFILRPTRCMRWDPRLPRLKSNDFKKLSVCISSIEIAAYRVHRSHWTLQIAATCKCNTQCQCGLSSSAQGYDALEILFTYLQVTELALNLNYEQAEQRRKPGYRVACAF